MEKPQVSFDEEGRIRVLDPEKFRQTEQLESECRSFVQSEAISVPTAMRLPSFQYDSKCHISVEACVSQK